MIWEIYCECDFQFQTSSSDLYTTNEREQQQKIYKFYFQLRKVILTLPVFVTEKKTKFYHMNIIKLLVLVSFMRKENAKEDKIYWHGKGCYVYWN